MEVSRFLSDPENDPALSGVADDAVREAIVIEFRNREELRQAKAADIPFLERPSNLLDPPEYAAPDAFVPRSEVTAHQMDYLVSLTEEYPHWALLKIADLTLQDESIEMMKVRHPISKVRLSVRRDPDRPAPVIAYEDPIEFEVAGRLRVMKVRYEPVEETGDGVTRIKYVRRDYAGEWDAERDFVYERGEREEVDDTELESLGKLLLGSQPDLAIRTRESR